MKSNTYGKVEEDLVSFSTYIFSAISHSADIYLFFFVSSVPQAQGFSTDNPRTDTLLLSVSSSISSVRRFFLKSSLIPTPLYSLSIFTMDSRGKQLKSSLSAIQLLSTHRCEPSLISSIYSLYGSIFSCARFVRYEGITVALAVEVVGVMMLLRIRAIYSNHVWITLFLSFFLLFETGINAWLIAHAGRKSPAPSDTHTLTNAPPEFQLLYITHHLIFMVSENK